MENKYVLKMEGITKEYFGNKVLKGVELKVKPGEIHALMGENGAGKSTLMNILFGMPVIHSTGGFGGTIEFNGEPVNIDNPHKAMELGIGMVHQEFMLIPGFTVTENVKLGREISNPTVASSIFGKSLEKLDKPAMADDTRKALNTIGLGVEDYARVAGMPVGYMQFIEIAREIDKTGIKLLIFDEPTAVLTESEADRLLDTMRVIASKGIAIIFITHRINEVIDVTDSMTVLRDGTFVERLETKGTTAARIAELMIGRQVEKLVDDMEEDNRSISEDDIMLSLKNFYVDMPGEKVKGVDLNLRRGEILGIGGLAGQGKVGIPNGILGLYPAAGEITFDGQKIDPTKLGDALQKGIAFVSEDRRGVGLLLNESIEQNIIFTALQIQGKFLKKYGPFTQFDDKGARNHALDMIKALDIRCTGPDQYAGRLSGGNQQKVCLARAITMTPKLLIVSEPTRGIDIGAKKLVLELLAKMNREQGMTIIMVSSELNELRSLCDRIAIVSDGKLTGIFAPDASDAEYGLAMSGVTEGGKV
ncbi:MAG: sugar ABC transporter ATP-binding protein [Oscillospiraceae bacterium]|nr:sugar ABC transporter ATP-binding protein [Oscillospiraceae bacterium]